MSDETKLDDAKILLEYITANFVSIFRYIGKNYEQKNTTSTMLPELNPISKDKIGEIMDLSYYTEKTSDIPKWVAACYNYVKVKEGLEVNDYIKLPCNSFWVETVFGRFKKDAHKKLGRYFSEIISNKNFVLFRKEPPYYMTEEENTAGILSKIENLYPLCKKIYEEILHL